MVDFSFFLLEQMIRFGELAKQQKPAEQFTLCFDKFIYLSDLLRFFDLIVYLFVCLLVDLFDAFWLLNR